MRRTVGGPGRAPRAGRSRAVGVGRVASRSGRSRAVMTGLAAITLVAAGGLTAACDRGSGTGSAATLIPVSLASCAGGGWTVPADGRLRVTVRNVDRSPLRVTLVDSAGSAVYAAVRALAPGTARALDVRLPDGSYHWECASPGGGPGAARSPDRRVTASGGGSRSHLVWVSPEEQRQLGFGYSMALSLRVADLLRAVADLDAAIGRGDLAGARARWVAAHDRYQVLGGAYGVFAELDRSINGLADGLPAGVADPGFTGFHKVEYLLWHGGRPEQLRAASRQLLADVRALARRARFLSVPLTELTRQAHEILERALLVELAGRGDYGCRCALAELAGDVAGTRDLVVRLGPLLRTRDPQLAAEATSRLDTIDRVLTGLRDPTGRWPALPALDREQRQRLDAAVGAAVEQLALIPTTLQTPGAGDAD